MRSGRYSYIPLLSGEISGDRRGEGVEIGAVAKALKVEAPELMGQV